MEKLYLWAWLAIGIAWLWVALWEALIAKKSLESMWKNPDLQWSFLVLTILWIALTESAAIYWLIVAFKILKLDPNTVSNVSKVIAAWLAIWIPWFWAWLWEWFLVTWAMEAILRNPDVKWKIMTYMVLFIALVESAAIYWLVIAMSLLK